MNVCVRVFPKVSDLKVSVCYLHCHRIGKSNPITSPTSDIT